MSLSKILKAAATTNINKTTQKQIDELLKMRKERKTQSARTTVDSRDTPSLKELELERILMNQSEKVTCHLNP